MNLRTLGVLLLGILIGLLVGRLQRARNERAAAAEQETTPDRLAHQDDIRCGTHKLGQTLQDMMEEAQQLDAARRPKARPTPPTDRGPDA